jgi:hypothetical protein
METFKIDLTDNEKKIAIKILEIYDDDKLDKIRQELRFKANNHHDFFERKQAQHDSYGIVDFMDYSDLDIDNLSDSYLVRIFRGLGEYLKDETIFKRVETNKKEVEILFKKFAHHAKQFFSDSEMNEYLSYIQ